MKASFVVVFLIACMVNLQANCETLEGGYSDIKDPDSLERYKNFARDHHNKASNSLYHHIVVEVLSAQQQVVAGLNIRLKLKLVQSECLKSDRNVDLSSCKAKGSVSRQ